VRERCLPMKILLQNIGTKLFYSVLGVWTENPNLAYHFRHPDQALAFARRIQMSNVQFVVRFDDPQWHEIIPRPVLVATLPARHLV
jgi:hypothetical protein